MKTLFLRFFAVEVAIVVVVGVLFSVIPDKVTAGLIAGSFFVAIGAWIGVAGLRQPSLRRTPTFALALVHLFLSALPMLLTRILNRAALFEDVRIWGLPGPVFHNVSTGIYFALMAATAFDWFRSSLVEIAGK